MSPAIVVLGRGLLPLLALLTVVAGCHRGTGRLSDEQQKRFEAEGIVRRAVDVDFHRTRAGGGRRSTWDEGYASIVVTRASAVIHSDDRILFEITPRSTGYYHVARDHDRVAIRGGRGQSAVSWSFRPAEDPEGWAQDVRAVIRNAAGKSRPRKQTIGLNLFQDSGNTDPCGDRRGRGLS